MEILDKVYKTFKNLDRDFSHSKKTRSQFIKDKFGGDITIGSVLILSAIDTEGVESPEDIEKLSFVKSILKKIEAAADRLDALSNFSFSENNLSEELFTLLENIESASIGVYAVPQKELYKREGCVHYVSTPKVSLHTDASSIVFKVFNENMKYFLEAMGFDMSKFSIGQYLVLKNDELRPVTNLSKLL